jgi:hypothetical protein
MKKLRLEDLSVESFSTQPTPPRRGTVYARESMAQTDITWCPDMTCDATDVCGSCNMAQTCADTCGGINYSCNPQDYRRTYGMVYPC